jgi:hypothetical protein
MEFFSSKLVVSDIKKIHVFLLRLQKLNLPQWLNALKLVIPELYHKFFLTVFMDHIRLKSGVRMPDVNKKKVSSAGSEAMC